MCYDFGMTTTTIRLPDDLKARVARVAERNGTSSHNFIVEAIAEKADDEERRQAFIALALAREKEIGESGRTIPWSAMKIYLEARAAGARPAKPRARKR